MGDSGFRPATLRAVREHLALSHGAALRLRERSRGGRRPLTPRASRSARSRSGGWLCETHGDDDLGQADLGSLLGTITGGTTSPEIRDALRILGPMLGGQNAPGGQSGQGGQGNRAPQGRTSSAELQQMLQQALRQGLGGL